MQIDKRDFRKFNKYPGDINIDENIYKFPSLYKTDKLGRLRLYNIFIRLIKSYNYKTKEYARNWCLLEDNEVEILKNYLKDGIKLPEGVIAQYYSETGIIGGKISRISPKFGLEKNLNRSNYRNSLQSALIQCNNLFLNKINSGYRTNIRESTGNLIEVSQESNSPLSVRESNELCSTSSSNSLQKNNIVETNNRINKLYFPMLLYKYENYKHKLDYTNIHVQPKLDGVRCISFQNNNKDIIQYSRQKKIYCNKEYITDELKQLYNIINTKYECNGTSSSLYLDGELYVHNVDLQIISGAVRNSNSDFKLELHIYDCFDILNSKLTFQDRIDILENIFSNTEFKYLKLTETIKVNNENMLMKYFKEMTNKKNSYEGVVIKVSNSLYKFSEQSSNTRSKNILKLKLKLVEEFEVYSYDKGRGRDKNAIIWICYTKDKSEYFKVVENTTIDNRKIQYKQALKNFNDLFKGRMMIVSFESLSLKGKPQRPRGLGFRDYK